MGASRVSESRIFDLYQVYVIPRTRQAHNQCWISGVWREIYFYSWCRVALELQVNFACSQVRIEPVNL
jgi:hypothetical protein